MDRQEEEGERRVESSTGKFIPLDLIHDILLKLPAKSVARFRCVSKLWSSITTPPDFLRSFVIHSSTRLRLMVCVKTSCNRLFISLPQKNHHDLDTSHSHCVYRYEIFSPQFDNKHIPCTESVHGLMCFGDFRSIVVWNPSTRQHVTLPQPEPRVNHHILSSLGYDPVEGKYKVLCLSGRICKDPLVFTLEPQGSWRLTHNCPLHIPEKNKGRLGACINGYVYYEATLGDTFKYEDLRIMSFHVRSEIFKTIERPAGPLHGLMLNFQGKLECVSYLSSTCLRFWVLEDGKRQEWSLREYRLPFLEYPRLTCLVLWGVTHDTGEFIFATTTLDSLCVLYCDPKRERTRRIEYEMIGDKAFWISNGVKLYDFDSILWFPNHSESLMSFQNVPGFVSNSDSE